MRYRLVDTFADAHHLGNPAAVAELAEPMAGPVLQVAARRIGVPTTAFLVRSAPGRYRVRWFTPHAEINLCGHATIASARVLFGQPSDSGRRRLVFESDGGVLSAEQVDDLIGIELPNADLLSCAPPPELLKALRITRYRSCVTSHDDVLVELDAEEEVAAVAPDFASLARQPFRGHIVTAPGSPESGVDFVSRTFFPALGVNEDQVCVSAHGKLAPFWAARLGRRVLSARQLSARGGRLEVEDRGRVVRVLGSAVPREGVCELAPDPTRGIAAVRFDRQRGDA